MASRTSNMNSQDKYLGTRRGRPIMDNFGFEMFPEKYELTNIAEDNPFDELNSDRRSTLKDYSPEQNSLFPYEAARRNTFARDRLNLREGGARVTTDPWQNEGFDTQFHDKDPRGYLNEPDWKEYRRLATTQFQNIDFKDDGSYQETGGGIHPNTLYKNIRGAQNWVKARLKIFSEEWEGRGNGGAGVYDNVSKVYRSDTEDTSVQVDGKYDDPEVAQHHNVNISNIVHLGSKALRTNTTTDHLVKVASYGKLYKNRGLINHESQMRIVEDDTPWSNIEGSKQTPKNLVKMMSSQIYADNAGISPYTASEIGRILMQSDQIETAANRGISDSELANTNRSNMLTKDIIALLGVTTNDIKYLESMEGKNRKMAEQMLGNIYDMATTVHAMSSNEKLQIRNELILRSAGMGLNPGDLRKTRDAVIVNPKIVEFMAMKTGKTAPLPGDSGIETLYDPENKLDNFMDNTSLFIYKTPGSQDNLISMKWETKNSDIAQDTSKKTASYKHLAKYSLNTNENTRMGLETQGFNLSKLTPEYSTMNIGETDKHTNLINTQLDNEFGENKYLNRHTGMIGTKQMRKHMDSDMISLDNMNEIGVIRKNAKNIGR